MQELRTIIAPRSLLLGTFLASTLGKGYSPSTIGSISDVCVCVCVANRPDVNVVRFFKSKSQCALQ